MQAKIASVHLKASGTHSRFWLQFTTIRTDETYTIKSGCIWMDKAERATCIKSYFGLVGWFVALRPKSTAMVIAGRSVHLTTLFPGQA